MKLLRINMYGKEDIITIMTLKGVYFMQRRDEGFSCTLFRP
jgi:hypothetical protein